MNERLQRFERLNEITRSLSNAPDVDAFLQLLVDAACEMTSSQMAAILRYNMAADNLDYMAVPFSLRDKLLTMGIPLEGSVAGWAFRHARPLMIADAATDERHFRDFHVLTGVAAHSMLSVPLLFRGAPIGVMEAVNKAADAHYTEEDVSTLETLAALAATALRERDLHQRLDLSSADAAALDRLKSDFIAITSHELRTPLGLILGHATFLRELAGEQFYEQLDAIVRNATRLKEIVENLSSVNTYEIGEARIRQGLVSMRDIVREVCESFQEEARAKDISLRTEVSTNPLTVEGEAGKISIALANLIQNALTFTDAGGNIVVNAESIPGFVKISVVDDGIGIPAQDLPRVFDRFFQVASHLTRKHGGMGLGLSVAKAMIELHGGRIWAESAGGRGANFIFLLPAEPSSDSAARKSI